jgi:hypothetical protein
VSAMLGVLNSAEGGCWIGAVDGSYYIGVAVYEAADGSAG